MMRFNMTGSGLTLAMLLMAACPASAKSSVSEGSQPELYKSSSEESIKKQMTSFVPENFNVPTFVETDHFKLVPLGPALVKVDFDAYMSSIDHLQKTFTRSADWPHKGISDADAMRDMEAEQARFRTRASFAYAVLTKDGRRERGCVYVYPSHVTGYDAVVRLWVTKGEYDAGFDAELFEWVTAWMQKDWPFATVAYPGRSISWDKWDAIDAASKPRKAAM